MRADDEYSVRKCGTFIMTSPRCTACLISPESLWKWTTVSHMLCLCVPVHVCLSCARVCVCVCVCVACVRGDMHELACGQLCCVRQWHDLTKLALCCSQYFP